MPTATREKPSDLKEACIQAAREVIAEQGVESLSMRDVSRKLGVSHQAPYRHFPSRDHLLAEIMRRCFVEFAHFLDGNEVPDIPAAGFEGMGERYIAYAQHKPLEYRLMFGTPWPEAAQHPELITHAKHAFDLLRQNLRRKHGNAPASHAQADLDALFIWSALHGMASIRQADVMRHLDLVPGVDQAFARNTLTRIGQAMDAAQPSNKGTEKK
jgi:AcrR family transcriptional regulator